MNGRILSAIILVLAVLLFFEGFGPNLTDNGDGITVSGNIEVTEIEISFEMGGRVKERFVDEGDYVKKDQIIATLDTRALDQEVAIRQAEIEAAAASLQEMISGYLPQEIKQAEAKVEQTKADLERLEADYARQKNLFTTNVISQKEFDASNAAFEVGQAKYREAEEQLALLKAGIRVEKIDQAKAKLKEVQEGLALSQTKLSYATLKAPTEGWVLSKNTEAGEVVSSGTPIVSIGNLNDIWLRAYVSELDLGRVKLGQKVRVTTDSYPKKTYHGTISFISSEAEFTPKNVQTDEERVKLVYRIKVKLENPDQELKPGMPADGIIEL